MLSTLFLLLSWRFGFLFFFIKFRLSVLGKNWFFRVFSLQGDWILHLKAGTNLFFLHEIHLFYWKMLPFGLYVRISWRLSGIFLGFVCFCERIEFCILLLFMKYIFYIENVNFWFMCWNSRWILGIDDWKQFWFPVSKFIDWELCCRKIQKVTFSWFLHFGWLGICQQQFGYCFRFLS